MLTQILVDLGILLTSILANCEIWPTLIHGKSLLTMLILWHGCDDDDCEKILNGGMMLMVTLEMVIKMRMRLAKPTLVRLVGKQTLPPPESQLEV